VNRRLWSERVAGARRARRARRGTSLALVAWFLACGVSALASEPAPPSSLENAVSSGRTWWAFGGGLLLLGVAASGLAHWRVRTLQQKTRRLEADIVARTRAEDALRDSEARYRVLFDQAGDYILVIDTSPNGPPVIRDANEAALRVFGYSRDELIGQPISLLEPGLSRETIQQRQQQSLESQTVEFEARHRRKDGSFFDAEVKTKELMIQGQRLSIAIERDITARKQTEQALRASEQQFRVAVNATNDGMWDINFRDGSARFSEPYAEAFGRPSETEDPMAWWTDHIHPDDRERVLASFNAVVNGSADVWKCEYRFRRLDGSWSDCYDRAYVTRDSMGRADYIAGALADLTDRKRAAQKEAGLEAQLQQAQKMESVGRLAGGVAHDFNNMLSIILGNADLALQQINPSHPLYADLQEIRHAAGRSADLTRQLLAFARKQVVAPRELNLNEAVASMLKMLQRLIGENIQLVWSPNAELWPIKLDPSQLDQILANLCVNARDAIAGAGKITIETNNVTCDEEYCAHHAYVMAGEYVRLVVSDSGCGMDSDTQAHLFEPFFTTKELGKGTGLGLATVYGSVKQNLGFITVSSAPNQGTTFSISLPRYLGEVEREREAD
jgi:PAS domain S-box-containing protein